nr:tyrosine-type recombinase/integrase [Sphingomonas sp.]
MLSVRKIQHAKPGRYGDGQGLYLLVKPSGTKSWVLRVQHNGRRRDIGLGTAITGLIDVDIPIQKRRSLTLAQAREKARLARELAKAGMDPSVLWRPQEEASCPSFEKVAAEYHRQVSRGWRNGKHADQWLTTLKIYAFPVIGQLAVDAIDARSIQRVLGPIWLEKGETARRVRQRIGVVLDYAHGKGWRDTEAPMRAVSQLLGGIKQRRRGNFAAMPYRDMSAFMARLRAGKPSVGRCALQFLILAGARSGEVRKAKWRDIDREAREWRLPPSTTKTDRLHIVPLVPAALALLDVVAREVSAGPDDFVFPGLTGPMSDATLAKMLRTNGGSDFTVHGFRSAFRDWAAETGFPDSWAEAALAHTNPNRTESAYRRTTFFEQRREKLMPAWASFLLEPSSPVDMPRLS